MSQINNFADNRRKTWAEALTLSGQPDLRVSLLAELAEYTGQPTGQVETRCRSAAADLARAWQEAAPATPEAVAAFYQQADAYLYDLTWWHALVADDSALIHVEALETALAHHAHTALDFGSGVGSQGLLLARHGVSVTLAEVNPRLNDYARWRFERRGLRARFLDLRSEPLAAGTFDFIAAVDVLEHLPDPRATLAALAASLRPGGTLFIHLPPESDSAHPQHLWHDVNVLLAHLSEAGLWLERASGPTLILRRGRGSCYSLNPGLELVSDPRSGILLLTRPLIALRLNSQAFDVLSRLDSGRTAVELSTETGLPVADLVTFLEDFVRRRIVTRKPPLPVAWPSVSLIVPARGRPRQTRACVESLLALDYPANRLEIIVVDDASDPPLSAALSGLPVQLVRHETNIGQSAVRNLAAAEARGDLLAFIDNDCVAAPGWLRALVPYLDDPTVGIVGGRVVSPPPEGRIATFEASRSPLDMGAGCGAVGPGEAVAYMPTCNLLVRREVLRGLGGFDVGMALGEDVDFIWRARDAGWRAWYAPEGRVVHHHRVQLTALLRRRADYGSSEADLQRRHPVGRRVMPLPLMVIMLLAALAAGLTAWPVSVALVALTGASLASEFGVKFRRLQRVGARLPAGRVIGAVLREHGAALYHLGANLTRYYGLPLLGAGLFWPPLLLPLAVLLLTSPITSYYRLRPRVSLPVFVGLYGLEMMAYQLGVWRGCLRWRTLRPFFPVLRLSQ
jgi:mycofactocin glycosyltransferase